MKYTEFTYVARLVTDPNMVVVRTESSLKTLKDWLDAARAKPKGVSVGGTGIGNADHVQLANIEKQAGTSFNYVPFDSGGQVMTNLLGSKVDSAMANPSEAYEQMRAGKVRALGITTDKRISDLPDVPTLKEQGVDYVVAQFRGVAGPKYQQVDGYMGSAEFTAFMDVFFKEQEQAFKDLPSLKQ